METKFSGFAAFKKGERLKRLDFDPGPFRSEQVEVKIEYCGVCHSDVSMIDDEWEESKFPLVPGHTIVGRIEKVGDNVKALKVGHRVGIGWFSASCMSCAQCLTGNQHLCENSEQIMIGRQGGFANRVRCHWVWATPLPDAIQPEIAGPLFCAGVTVFNPIVISDVKPTSRVGVIGIGGLGHLALQFLNKWGCEVFAFSTSPNKRKEIMKLGAHHVINPCKKAHFEEVKGKLDFILSTVYVQMNWETIIDSLAPNGRLHFVGTVPDPIEVDVFQLIDEQRVVAASPVGSPRAVATMLDFCARHCIAPRTEQFPMSRINTALERLRSGRVRFRGVVKNDLD